MRGVTIEAINTLCLSLTLCLSFPLSYHMRREKEEREKKTYRTDTHFMSVYMANARADHDPVLICFPSPTYHILTRR